MKTSAFLAVVVLTICGCGSAEQEGNPGNGDERAEAVAELRERLLSARPPEPEPPPTLRIGSPVEIDDVRIELVSVAVEDPTPHLRAKTFSEMKAYPDRALVLRFRVTVIGEGRSMPVAFGYGFLRDNFGNDCEQPEQYDAYNGWHSSEGDVRQGESADFFGVAWPRNTSASEYSGSVLFRLSDSPLETGSLYVELVFSSSEIANLVALGSGGHGPGGN